MKVVILAGGTGTRLIAYKHKGFWQCMDTLKDKIAFNEIWKKGNPPWKIRK